jgi:hypothetical protein
MPNLIKCGAKYRAALYVYEIMTAFFHKSGNNNPAFSKLSMKGSPPTAIAMSINHRVNSGVQLFIPESRFDNSLFPLLITCGFHMLNRTAPAAGEVRAKGFYPLRRSLYHLKKPGFFIGNFYPNGFTGERVGDIVGAKLISGKPLTILPEVRDLKYGLSGLGRLGFFTGAFGHRGSLGFLLNE